MEIGALGMINTLLSSTNNQASQSSASAGFSGIFGAMIIETAPNGEVKDQISEPSMDVISELFQLLKTDDILELDGGLELLDQALSNDEKELFSLIETYMGLEGEDSLINLLSRFQDEVSSQTEEIANSNLTKEFIFEGNTDAVLNASLDKTKEIKIDEITNDLPIEENMISILTQIISLPMNDFSKRISGEMKDVIVAVKLFELLGGNQDSKSENAQLKDLLNQLMKKLELIDSNPKVGTDSGSKFAIQLGNEKQLSKDSFLQKTFTPVVAHINAQLSTSKGSSEGQKEQSQTAKLESVNGFLQLHTMSKPEQLTLTLNQSGKPTTSAHLIKQFENILSKSQFSNIGGSQKLLIKLTPEHLGSLRIELIQRDSGLIARILTTTLTAKDTLDSQINGLRQAFSSQNIQVDKIEINQQFTVQQERFLGKDSQQQSHQQGQERPTYSGSDDAVEDQSFNYSFEEALLNMEV